MRRAFDRIVIIGTFLVLAPAGRAADPAGGPPPAIDKLIAQLGDNRFRVRQAAVGADRFVGTPRTSYNIDAMLF